jgi:hypothetical protein
VVRLKEGANLLLLKVENAEVLWECTARINYQPDLDGLREQAQRGLEAARGTALITLSDAGLGPRYRHFFIFRGGVCLETPEIGRGVRLPPGEYDVRVGFPSGHVGRTVRVAADEEVVVPSALYTFERLRPPESLSDLPQSLYSGDEYLGTFYGGDTVRLYPGEYTVVTGRQETVIDEWEVIGPFPNPDNAGRETVYPPEEGIDLEAKYPGLDGKLVGWQHMAGMVQVPLHEIMPAGYAVAYAYATFESEEDTDRAILQVGSDDGVRAWLNGEVVWTNHAIRPLSVDHVRVRLKKGRNTLLLKIDNSPYQGEFGRWECSAAVTLLEGKTIRLVAE